MKNPFRVHDEDSSFVLTFLLLAVAVPFVLAEYFADLARRAFAGAHSVRSSAGGCVAALLIASVALAGCTPAQQQTTLQVVTDINAHIPEVEAAAQTAAAAISILVPADAAAIGVADTAFTAAAGTLQALTAAYLKNPSASVLTQIQTAIATLEGQINSATLNATGIKDVKTQQLVLAALKGLLTVVTVVFALIAPTLTTAQLFEIRGDGTIHLARVRRYMDEGELRREAKQHGTDVDREFARAEAFGF